MESVDEGKIPVLFKNKKDCCGCGACLNTCPQNAIHMDVDECGFWYPIIDASSCVGCRLCVNACNFQNSTVENDPISVYAASVKDQKQLFNSSSGGIAALLSRIVIENGGIVFGAAFNLDWSVNHISITNRDEIMKIQGSKYLHSSVAKTYSEAKKYLSEGRMVMFSGTPCQIDGLYGYLGKKYDNLLTIDIVCHGVPSTKMFQDSIRHLEKKYGGKVIRYTFRDKKLGWGTNGSAIIETNGKHKKIKLWESSSTYIKYFTSGWLYRESCYECKYASSHRPADITLGDFWGVEKVHPDFLNKNGFDDRMGISMVMINTENGRKWFGIIGPYIMCKDSSYEHASRWNGNLREPSKPGMRDELLSLYQKKGWEALENRFNRQVGVRKYLSPIKSMIPISIKRNLKRRMK